MPCGYDINIYLTENIVVPNIAHMCGEMLAPSTECNSLNSSKCKYISKIIKQTFTLSNAPYFVIKCEASTSTESSDPPPPPSSETFAYPTKCAASTINSSPITTPAATPPLTPFSSTASPPTASPPTAPPPIASHSTTSSPTTLSPLTSFSITLGKRKHDCVDSMLMVACQ